MIENNERMACACAALVRERRREEKKKIIIHFRNARGGKGFYDSFSWPVARGEGGFSFDIYPVQCAEGPLYSPFLFLIIGRPFERRIF